MTGSKLEAALAWAARGFRVFPLRPGTNEPYGGSHWIEEATRDPASIESAWRDPVLGFEQEHNIGVLTDDLIVVDVDVKDGKQGIESLLALDLPSDTLTVRTPSGGLHLYFRGPNRSNGVNRLGDGLDIRSYHGYVVAPGSETPKGVYTLSHDAPMRDAPEHLLAKLDAPRARSASAAPIIELDTSLAVASAELFLLEDAEAPVQGSRNHALFRAAAQVKDLGVSRERALDLIETWWNPRLAAPLERGEIEKTVNSAFDNGQLAPGSASPLAHFAGVKVDMPPPPPETPPGVAGLLAFRPFRNPLGIPRRPWVLKRMLLRGFVTTLIAPGGAGKSTLQLTIAAHLAMGRAFAGFEPIAYGKPLRSVVVNLEDDRDEMERRMNALCIAHGFDPAKVAENVVLLPGTEYFFRVADGSRQFKARDKELAGFVDECKKLKIDVVMVDPLNLTHDVDVNDNQGLNSVMALYRALAHKAEVAVLLAHHTSKGSARERRAGDATSSLGAGAVVNSSRIAFTLFEATEEDSDRFSIPPAQRHRYVRLDDAKSNYAAATSAPVWFERIGVDLPNGDGVGGLRVADLREDAKAEVRAIAETLAEEFRARNIVSATTYECVKFLVIADPIYANQVADSSHKTMQRKIEKVLGPPFALADGGSIRFTIEKKSAEAAARNLIVLD